MSRIQGTRPIAAPQNDAAQNSSPQKNEARAASNNDSVYQANNDSAHDKFNSREGIDRAARGNGNGHRNAHAHGQHGKHKGDSIDVAIEGIGDVQGRVLNETTDTLEVLVDGEIYLIDKKSGNSRSNRKATQYEMQQGQQMQQQQAQQEQQRQEVQAQDRRSEVITDNIKVSNRKHDARIVDLKKEIKTDEAEALERATTKKITVNAVKQEYNDSTATVFQVVNPKTPHRSLSVAEIILGKEQKEQTVKLKEQTE